MYCEVVVGSVMNRNRIIESHEMSRYVSDAMINRKELYRSYYLFDEDLKKHVERERSVRSYDGKAYLDSIKLDIDKGADTDNAVLERARSFFQRLQEIFNITQIRPYYSGSGYHFVIPDYFGFEPSVTLPMYVRATMTSHFPECDDIYDKVRIIRTSGSFNAKTHRFKIPLTPFELMTFTSDDVIELAQNPRMDFIIEPFKEVETHLHEKIVAPDAKETTRQVVKAQPTRMVTCMQKLYAKGGTQGSRHQELLRLAAYWRKQGILEEGSIALAKSWAPDFAHDEVKKIIASTYKTGYVFSCKDKVMVEHCDSQCFFYKHKNYVQEIYTAKQMEESFRDYLRKDFSSTSFNLNEIFSCGNYSFFPGELVVFIGDTGIGKTAVLQNLAVNLKRMKILYLSLEVDKLLMYRRFVQISNGMTKDQIYKHYQAADNHLSDGFDHITLTDSAVTLDGIKKLIAEQKPHLVIIDTLDCIQMELNDLTQRTDKIAKGLKTLAQETNTIIMTIAHISKGTTKDAFGNPIPLSVHSAKGASTIEQQADKVIGIEATSPTARRIRSLKSRDESMVEFSAMIDWNTFTVN